MILRGPSSRSSIGVAAKRNMGSSKIQISLASQVNIINWRPNCLFRFLFELFSCLSDRLGFRGSCFDLLFVDLEFLPFEALKRFFLFLLISWKSIQSQPTTLFNFFKLYFSHVDVSVDSMQLLIHI